jgi:hypothetical protein
MEKKFLIEVSAGVYKYARLDGAKLDRARRRLYFEREIPPEFAQYAEREPQPPPLVEVVIDSEEQRAASVGAYIEHSARLAEVLKGLGRKPAGLEWAKRIRRAVDAGKRSRESYAAELADMALRVRGRG